MVKNPNLLLSVPVFLFKIQPESCINPFAVAQDPKGGLSVPSGKHLWDVLQPGCVVLLYSTPKTYLISLCDWLAFLKGTVGVPVSKISPFLLLF